MSSDRLGNLVILFENVSIFVLIKKYTEQTLQITSGSLDNEHWQKSTYY